MSTVPFFSCVLCSFASLRCHMPFRIPCCLPLFLCSYDRLPCVCTCYTSHCPTFRRHVSFSVTVLTLSIAHAHLDTHTFRCFGGLHLFPFSSLPNFLCPDRSIFPKSVFPFIPFYWQVARFAVPQRGGLLGLSLTVEFFRCLTFSVLPITARTHLANMLCQCPYGQCL